MDIGEASVDDYFDYIEEKKTRVTQTVIMILNLSETEKEVSLRVMSDLTKHVKSLHKKKKFLCESCEYLANQESNLKTHII